MVTSLDWLEKVQWGTAGEWAGALGAIVAAAVALTIAVRGERRERDLRLRAGIAGVVLSRSAERENLATWLVLTVVNGSGHPIRDVSGDCWSFSETHGWFAMPETVTVLMPGERHSFASEAVPLPNETPETPVRVTDASGHVWALRPEGDPVRIPRDGEPRRRWFRRRGSKTN